MGARRLERNIGDTWHFSWSWEGLIGKVFIVLLLSDLGLMVSSDGDEESVSRIRCDREDLWYR